MKYARAIFLLISLFFSTQLAAQTVLWKDSLSTAKVYLQIAEEDYRDHPHRRGRAYDVIESSPKFHEIIIRTTYKALRKYPSAILNEHVGKLYMYDQFDKCNNIMGLYRVRHGFLFAVPHFENGEVDTLDLERVIHHEISHRLLMFEGKHFNLRAWKQNNGLRYGKIKSHNRDFAPDLYARGFINKFSVTNKFEDFATFAENIFIHKPAFWKAIEAHTALRNKFDIICQYFESLDPSMNQAYFLKLNGITLADKP